jgi:hypothetical protein
MLKIPCQRRVNRAGGRQASPGQVEEDLGLFARLSKLLAPKLISPQSGHAGKDCHKGTKTRSNTFSLFATLCLCVLVVKLFFIKCKKIRIKTLADYCKAKAENKKPHISK